MKRKLIILSIIATSSPFVYADNFQIIPRIGASLTSYEMSLYSSPNFVEISEVGYGVNAGATLSNGKMLLDLSTELMMIGDDALDITRSEIAVTLGVAVYKSLYLIGGYRQAEYGDGAYANDYGKMDGPFIGISLSGLSMGEDGKDLFDVSFVLNEVSFKSGNIEQEGAFADSGTIRIGYRRAGSPHGFGLKYQSYYTEAGFGGFEDFSASLTYTYSFY